MPYQGIDKVDLSGLLGGMYAAEANNSQRGLDEANTLNTIFQANQAGANTRYRDLESERFGQMTPLELQIKGLEAAKATALNTPDNLNTLTRGTLGTAQSAAANGQFDTDTLAGRTKATNAGNTMTVDQLGAAKGLAALRGGFAEAQSKGMLSGHWENFLGNFDTGNNPTIKDAVGMLKTASPKMIPVILDRLDELVAKLDPKNIARSVEQKQKFEFDKQLTYIKEAGDNRRAALREAGDDERSLRQILASSSSDVRSFASAQQRAEKDFEERASNILYLSELRKNIQGNPENRRKTPAEIQEMVAETVKKRKEEAIKPYKEAWQAANDDAERVRKALLEPDPKKRKEILGGEAKTGEWKVVK